MAGFSPLLFEFYVTCLIKIWTQLKEMRHMACCTDECRQGFEVEFSLKDNDDYEGVFVQCIRKYLNFLSVQFNCYVLIAHYVNLAGII